MCECCGGHNESVILNVKGMSCNHCVESVKSNIISLKGIKSVQINLQEAKVSVQYNPNDVKVEHIKEAITNAGYEVL